jgi:hypothetical protein
MMDREYGQTNVPRLLGELAAGAQAEVLQSAGDSGPARWMPVERVTIKPGVPGPNRVTVYLAGAGFSFAGPGALPLRWRVYEVPA